MRGFLLVVIVLLVLALGGLEIVASRDLGGGVGHVTPAAEYLR
jgi:hypothetical protein